MAQLTLTVLGDVKDVTEKIAKIKNDVQSNPIKIKIETEGDVKALQAQAKLEAARAKIIKSENDLRIAQERTRQSTEKRSAEEAKLATQMEKTATAEEQARTANTKLQQQIEKTNTTQKQAELQAEKTKTKEAELALQEEKTATAAERRAAAESKATGATKTLGDETEKTARKSESLLDNFLKFARWYVIGNAFSAIVRSMREALGVMKQVDDELVTIRKVTGFSGEQIAGIKEQAYSTASAYGVGAADYLESVATFSRAGYKEQAAALAELSTKTQIVGDTTADVANQFLLSVDAAYKYNGSIKELTAVLDGANEIDNKYATSIEKIAEGMGIVAPVAAQMHVTIDELAASIGTITAVTQRSGSEAARALRALFLNIAGDTKTEIDEGVTWTTGEIEGLRDVIKQYAKDAYDAAQATGSVIDPMRAMEGLAKSMQEGVLTEQKLMEMVSDIGGKLRTSQLLAIIQNWDMYQSMLQDYAGAIGSADKEVENALDSWTRKTNQLKNEWAEFVSNLLDTSSVKGALDAAITVVGALDTGLGRAVVTVVTLTAAVVGLRGALAAMRATESGSAFLAVLANPQTLAIAGAIAAVYGIVKAVDALNVTYDEQKEKLDELNSKYDSLYGKGSEIDTLREKTGELTWQEEQRLAVLQAEEASLKEQLKTQRTQTFEAWRKEQSSNMEWKLDDPNIEESGRFVNINGTQKLFNDTSAALRDLNKEYINGSKSASEYKSGVQGLVTSLKESVDAINLGREAGVELTSTERGLLSLYETLITILVGKTEAEVNDTNAKKENAGKTKELTAAEKALKTAFEEVEKKSSLTYGTLAELDAIYPGLSKKILDANGKLTEEGKAALSTKAALFELISSMISANTTSLNFDSQISTLYDLAIAAGVAGAALDGIFGTAAGGPTFTEDGQLDVSAEKSYIRAKSNPERTLSNIIKNIKTELTKGDWLTTGGGGGGGGGGSSASEKDEELERLKSIVSLRKQELAFLKESGASDEDILAKQKEIQAALHDEAEYLRTTEAYLNEDADALREVKALSTEWWSIQNDINDALEKAAKKLRDDIADVMGDIADSLKDSEEAITKPLQEQLDALEAAHDATKNRREEEEKILAVEKARIALENAQNERTVRQYNAATGQWEWVADAKKVESARQSLADAEAALADYYADQKYQAQKAALDAQIQNTKSAFDALKDAIDEAAKAIKDGKMSFEDAYAYIKAAMQQIYDDYGIDLSGELENIVGGFSTVNDNIRTLIDEIIATLSEAYFAAKAAGDWEGMERAHDAANGLRAIVGDEPTDASVDIANTKRASVIAEMQAHSAAWFDADEEERQRLANRNMELGTSMGWHREHGAWYDEDGKRVYDSGGILHGTGGIKATNEDEMILPPDMTAKLLRAEASGGFEALLAHLGIVTAAAQSYKALQTSKARTTIGTQNNGNTYNLGGISLSEQQARSMTVYDLAQMARNLSIAT